eukprot:2133058-Rhodomonas_salina.2
MRPAPSSLRLAEARKRPPTQRDRLRAGPGRAEGGGLEAFGVIAAASVVVLAVPAPVLVVLAVPAPVLVLRLLRL